MDYIFVFWTIYSSKVSEESLASPQVACESLAKGVGQVSTGEALDP